MGVTQPISLLRLRSATNAYIAVLRASLPELELMAEAHELPGLPNPTRDLLESVETTLDPVHGGGVTDILRCTETVLGSE